MKYALRALIAMLLAAWPAGRPDAALGQSRAAEARYDHTLRAHVVDGTDQRLTRDLRFPLRSEYLPGDRVELFTPDRQPIHPSDGVELVTRTLPATEDGSWPVRLRVHASFDEPGLYVVGVYGADAHAPKALVGLPLVPVRPYVAQTFMQQPPGYRVDAVQVAPSRPLEAQVVVEGGPFFEGTTASLQGHALATRRLARDRLAVRVDLPPGAAAALSPGEQTLVLSHPLATWEVPVTLFLDGPPPEVLSWPAAPLDALGAHQTIELHGRHFAPHPTVRVTRDGSGYRIDEQLLIPKDAAADHIVVELFTPRLEGTRTSGSFNLTVVNPDGDESTVPIRVRQPVQTVRAEPLDDIIYDVPTPVRFRIQGNTSVFYEEAEYVLLVEEREVPLDNLLISDGGDVLSATIRLPQRGGGSAAGSDRLDFRLRSSAGQAWTGVFEHVLHKPRLSDEVVTLRPGERRVVYFHAGLEGYRLVSPGTHVDISGGELDDRAATLEIDPNVGLGETITLPVYRKARQVDAVEVRIVEWAPVDYLEWSQDPTEQAWTPVVTGVDALTEIDQDQVFRIRGNGRQLEQAQPQLVYVSVVDDGGRALLAEQALEVDAGDVTRPLILTPRSAGLEGGDRFVLRMRTTDRQLPDQVFFVRREGLEKWSISGGLSALQYPFSGESDREILFDGVQLSFNYTSNRISRALGSDAVAFSLNLLFSRGPEGSGLTLGAGPGVLLFNKLMLGVGFDPQENLNVFGSAFLFLGTNIELTALR